MTNKENEEYKNSKGIIQEILKSNELSIILSTKLGKYSNTYKRNFKGTKSQYKGRLAKLEEGYESSDSGDSVQSTSTILTSTSSSTYSLTG